MSNLHEDQMALDIRGVRSKNSGAGFFKGDVFNKDWVIEGKSSLDPKMLVTVGLLNEAVREAKTRHKKPAIGLAYITGDPLVPRGLTLQKYCYMVPLDRGPTKAVPQKKILIDLSEPVEEKTYRFEITDPMVSEWWRVLKVETTRKRLGKPSSRLV